jgi:hypothetical protein
MKYKVIKEMQFVAKSFSSSNNQKYDVIKIGDLVTSTPKSSLSSYKTNWFFKMCKRDDHNVRRILFEFNGRLRTAVIGKDVVAVMEE